MKFLCLSSLLTAASGLRYAREGEGFIQAEVRTEVINEKVEYRAKG